VWKLRIGYISLIVGGSSTIIAIILSLIRTDSLVVGSVIIILAYLVIASFLAYLSSEILWQTVFRKNKVTMERKAADDIAGEAGKMISDIGDVGGRFGIKVIHDEYGSFIEFYDNKTERMAMFVRVSLSYVVRHFSLCIPRREGEAIIHFDFFSRKELVDEIGKETGFLMGIVDR
jgi:hypothetical protein